MTTKTRAFHIDINHAWCKGCEICAAFCPKNVFTMNGKEVVVIDPDACTGCLLCEMYCPDFAVKVTPADNDVLKQH
ncbi:MAG: 4Fe-4S binding protein [candidate division WOR-3 bacterium]|nr:MAG: 4Fe-4S binding protein [candidate division WOR-3 bacterium]